MFSLTHAGTQASYSLWSPCRWVDPLHHRLALVAKWSIFWRFLRPHEACVGQRKPGFDACASGGLADATSFFTLASSLVHCKSYQGDVEKKSQRASQGQVEKKLLDSLKQAWTGAQPQALVLVWGPQHSFG